MSAASLLRTSIIPRSIALLAMAAAPGLARAADDAIAVEPNWLGMNLGHVKGAGEVRAAMADFASANLSRVRAGGNAVNDPEQDAYLQAMLDAGMTVHWVINFRGHGLAPKGTTREELPQLDIDGPVMQAWADAYKARCRTIFEAYSKPGAEKVLYYIAGNEPNLRDNFTSLHGRPDVAVRLTKAMFEAAREVNPKIIVQSPPVSKPDAPYLREMLALGLANYCDVIGTHVYGGQINPTTLDAPWRWQAEVGARLPVASSESGVTLGWAPKGLDARQWQSDWVASWYVMCRRMGYRTGTLFTHDDDHKPDWALLRTKDGLVQPAFDEIATRLRARRGLSNGGFEEPNDRLRVWYQERDVDDANMPDHFDWQHADAHAGQFAARARGDVRWSITAHQVVEPLQPGVPVEVTAMLKASAGGGARLSLGGYDPRDGDATVSSELVRDTEWKRVTVRVTPVNPWVVISLTSSQADVPGYAHFDDIVLSPSVADATAAP